MSLRQRLEQRHSLEREQLALVDPAGEEHQPGEGTPRISLAELVADPLTAFEHLRLRLDRRVELVRHKALVRAPLQQLRSLGRSQPVRESQGPGELRARLAVRTAARRLLTGLRCPSQHRVTLARGLGMIGQARQVRTRASAVLQRDQHGPMKRDATVGRNRVLDRDTRELVPKANIGLARVEHPRTHALLEHVKQLGSHGLQQPEVGSPRNHGGRLEQPECRTGEPPRASEHRITHRRRNAFPAGGQHLGHEERVAAGDAVEIGRVRVGRRRQRSDGFQRHGGSSIRRTPWLTRSSPNTDRSG